MESVMRLDKFRDMLAAAMPGFISGALFLYLAATLVFGVGKNLTY